MARGAALFLVMGMATGCSSQVARFGGGGIDDVFTGSTTNQKQVAQPNQPYPDMPPVSSGSVSRGALAPVSVSRGALAPVSSTGITADNPPIRAAEPARAPEPVRAAPVRTASLEPPATRPFAMRKPSADDVLSAAPKPAKGKVAAVAEDKDPAGWSRAGGTQVTIREGETVYNLSRRFGVPAATILKVNGLTEAEGLQAGQRIVIPTYVYSQKAPVSSPDSNPKVAAAKSSRGTRDVPAGKPGPDDVAVLPKAGKAGADRQEVASAEPKTPKAAKPAAGGYVVQEGDSLAKIARKTGVSTAELKKANGLSDGRLKIGQTLALPSGQATVAAAKPATPDPIVTGTAGPAKPERATAVAAAYTPPKVEKTMEQAEDDQSVAPSGTGIGRMRWPVRGKVITPFGKTAGRASEGIDIAVPEGTAVKAAENGVVIYAGDGLKDFGNTVLVRHDNGLVTVYGNASALKVARGEKVKRGQEIATSGMTGNASSPKLHFEVRKNSAPVDPSTFLE